MSKISDLKKELRELRKKHCPPTGKMKKADVMKEIERLRGVETVTEYVAPESKPRAKKAKVEKKEMAVQADVEEQERETMAERMARVRAGRKIAGAVKKAVEAKKEKKETEEKVETMKKKVAGRKVAEAVKKMVEAKKEKKEEEKPKKRKIRKEKKEEEFQEFKPSEKEEREYEEKKRKFEEVKKLVREGMDIEEAVKVIEQREKAATKKKQKFSELDGKYVMRDLQSYGKGALTSTTNPKINKMIYKLKHKEDDKFDFELVYLTKTVGGAKEQYTGFPERKTVLEDVKIHSIIDGLELSTVETNKGVFLIPKENNDSKNGKFYFQSIKEVEKSKKSK